MRGLSLKQPWLHCITHVNKRVENRTWKIPDKHLNKWIALHASMKTESMEVWKSAEYLAGRLLTGYFQNGAILAVAKFSHIITTEEELEPDQRKWFFGPFGWFISEVVVFDRGIPYKGKLGLWRLDSITEDRIQETIDREHRRMKVFESVRDELDHYEQKFEMSSEDFIKAFQNGSLPDNPEFFNWQLAYTGYKNLRESERPDQDAE